ncbi:MAG: TrbI/VirB10 family protein [Propionivibrio sp.]
MEAPIEPDLGKWKVKRNLHYWIVALVGIVLAVFLFSDAFKKENPSDEKAEELRKAREKEVATLNRTENAPAKEDLDKILRDQAKDAEAKKAAQVPDSASVPANLLPGMPPLPTAVGKPATNLPSPESMRKEPDQAAANAAKREEQIMSSPIMAIDSSSKLNLGNARNTQSPSVMDDARKELAANARKQEEMYDKVLSSAAATGGAAAAGATPRKSSASGSNDMFLESMANSKTAVNDVVRPIASRGTFALMQGAVIPAVLVSEIRSDLPGEIKAQTTMDVYDSVNGTVLLIPKGTVLVGKYNSEVRVGQEKVMAGFSRMIFPSGASADLGGMKGAEGSGESGLADDVDNHFWKMFGTNFLIAGLAQAFQNSGNNSTTVTAYGTTNVSNTAGEVLADTVKVINQRNVSIPPTIYVYRGHKFNVMVNKDMILPPYQTGVRQ